MNSLRLWSVSFVFILTIQSAIFAEVLIFKTDENGFLTTLSNAESIEYSDRIGGILLKYQWPMSIASTLSEAETNELLTPTNHAENGDFIRGREELFIQKKLQETLPELNLHVAFIPTCLYELFCLLEEYENNYGYNLYSKPLNDALEFPLLTAGMVCANIQPLLTGAHKSLKSINKSMYNLCTDLNEEFYMRLSIDHESAFMFINNKIINSLGLILPLQDVTDVSIISRKIYQSSFAIYKNLIDKFKAFPKDSRDQFDYLKPASLDQAKAEQFTELIVKIIGLEYECYWSNQALLLRGSAFKETPINFKSTPATKLVAGNTIYLGPEQVNNLLQLYKNKELAPYSISFANSFFAGFVNDITACAYHYLMQKVNKLAVAGYGLFINKKEYVNSQIDNLFFIPSLSTLVALYEQGEFFHARMKVAVAKKEVDYDIQGIACPSFQDPYGFFVLEEDPLKFAERFSQYLIKNGRIIQLEDQSLPGLKSVESDFLEKIMQGQQEIVKFYHDIRKIKMLLDEDVAPRYKAKKENIEVLKRKKLFKQLSVEALT